MTGPEDDVDRIMVVMAAAFDPSYGEAWSRRQVLDALILGNCYYRIVDEVEPKGFYLSRHGFDEEELLLLAVAPTYRGAGLGGSLLDDFLSAAKARGARRALLEMRRGNTAERLYASRHFQQIGERPRYYRTADGISLDAITLALNID